MRLVFDLESNGWRDEADQIWCLVFEDLETKEVHKLVYTDVDFLTRLEYFFTADEVIGHNIINYDLPLIKRLTGIVPTGKVTDTLVLSRLFNPDRKGGHSIDAWGKKLGRYKPAHEDWSRFSEDMLHRCAEDTGINVLVYHELKKEENIDDTDWSLSIYIEHEVARIITQQEINGVWFNTEKAVQYIKDIDTECDDIYKAIRPMLSKEVKQPYKTPVNKPFLKGSGKPSGNLLKWYTEEECAMVQGPFSRVEFSEPDMNSREKFKKQLLALGWKPQHFTEKGSPQLTTKNEYDETVACPSLEETLGELGARVARYFILRHRQGQIKGWVLGPKASGFKTPIRADHRIPAGAIPDGTPTHRMTHRVVANVPRVTSVFGKEMRSLFGVDPDEDVKQIGADLSGLELRNLAHRMRDPKYVEAIISKDIHVYNQEAANLDTRDQAKKFIYTFLYGGGDAKVGHAIGGGASAGKKIKAKFLNSLPKLDKLLRQVKKAAERGYLIGLDGRKIWMRRDEKGKVLTHKALNTLLQCDGAIVAKVALIFMDKNIFQKEQYKAKLLITYHDEVQVQAKSDQAETVGNLLVKCFETAGTFLKTSCPITGEFKIGYNWGDCH